MIPDDLKTVASAPNSDEWIAYLAPGAASGLPLDQILLALAEDAGDRQLKRTVAAVGEELRRGADLNEALHAAVPTMPAYLQRAFEAAQNPGRFSAIIAGLARHQATRKRLRQQLVSILLYPAVVLILLATIVIGLSTIVVPQFRDLYRGFDLFLPDITRLLLEGARIAPWFFLIIPAVPICYAVFGMLPGGRRMMHWLRTGTPFFGRIWIYSGQHEFASILGALVEQRLAMVDALRTTVTSLRDRNLARATRIVADKCEAGSTLSQALADSLHFDRGVTAFVHWGENHDALAEALGQARIFYEEEIDLQAAFLRRVLPPILFIVVTCIIFFFVVALLIPMVDLVNNLSG